MFLFFSKTKPRAFANLLRNAAKSWRVSIMLLHWLPRDFFLLFWCKWKLFTLKKPGFHAPLVLKTLLHGTKVPKLASRARARANSQLGARQLGSWRAPSPDLARQLATWRAPNVPPPIKPSTCIPLLSLEIPSLTCQCPCTLGTKKALFHLFLINVQKTANVQEAVKSII